jgi:endonuclease/exonuclease/phosphatase (EEP) superfamily protein YafD
MQFKQLRLRVGNLVEAAAALAAVGTLVAFGGRWWWVLELFSHFRMHYLAGLVVGVACCAKLKRWRLAAVFGASAAINLALIVPLYLPANVEVAKGRDVRLMLANVHVHNRDHETFLRLVRDESPDVIVVLEVSGAWLEALESLAVDYPHRISRPREDSFGIALLSRLPTEQLKVREIGSAEVPSVVAQIDCGDGVVLQLVGTHPLPPVSGEYADLRNEQLRDVGEFVAKLPRPTVLAGDCNATSWSPVFRDLVAASRLGDSRRGFGIQPTWPGTLATVGIPIDHVLVSSDIAIVDRRVLADIGSDHRPVAIDLRVDTYSEKNASTTNN